MPKKRVGLKTEKSEEARQGKETIRRNPTKKIQTQDLHQSTELLGAVAQQLDESRKTLQVAHKLLNRAAKLLAKSRRKDV